jgi:hypothetical protein
VTAPSIPNSTHNLLAAQVWAYFEKRLDHPKRLSPDRTKVAVRCPFHPDHDPSATVFRDGGFNCHGCGFKGGLLDFEMKFSNCDREAALKNIAELTGAHLNGNGRHRTATYTYVDANRIPVFRKHRYEPRGFSVERRDQAGNWVKELAADTPRVLYNLPDVVTANLVLVAEGEKDCDNLSAFHLWPERKHVHVAATTNFDGAWQPGSAPKWRDEYNRFFGGKDVVIFEDNDAAGWIRADYIAAQIQSLAFTVRRISFRNMPPKSDVSDWLERLDPQERQWKLEELIESASLWQPEPTPKTVPATGYILTSIAELFQKPDVPLDYVWDGRLVAGTLSCCVAKPKVGKGTMARNLALAVARGEIFLGEQCKQGEVVYLALEEREEEIKADFKALGATGEEPIYIHAAPAPEAAVPELLSLVRQRRPRLLVIDPLIRLARIRDEKAYAETYAALGPLIDVAREVGTHILLLHHSSKVPKLDAIDAPLGSTAFGGIPATLIYLMRTSGGYRTIQTVQRIGKDLSETVLNFNEATKRLTAGGTRKEREEGDAGQRILDYLDPAQEPQTEQAIRDAVEGKTEVLHAALKTLLKTGKIERSGGGKKGNPFLYKKFLFPSSQPISGTREQECGKPPETRMTTDRILVPDFEALDEEREQAFQTREQAF